jgi:acetyl-CoA carboxylase carboxyltransferase component
MAVDVAEKTHERLTPWQRLELLCDEGSLRTIRSDVQSRRMGNKSRSGDGVVGAAGMVDGRTVFCYAQDQSFAGGSLGEAHADTIVRVLRLAKQARAPVVGFIESAGARMQEGVSALGGYGRIFYENVALSGQVPQISVIVGTSAGGGSYSPALTDFVVMTRQASMFLTGPGVVREVLGEDVGSLDLGGSQVHERNGVCQFTAPSDVDSIFLVRDILSYMPQNAWEAPARESPSEPSGQAPSSFVPTEQRRVYDIRDVVASVVDKGRLLETSPKWARNLVCGFARIDGASVGVIANQPRYLGGTIDADASQKGARFVQTCSTFGIPLVVFVDTPGFMPGTKQECAGVIRHGAKLLHAFAEAKVPRLTVILRKAYGGAYITMNSKDLGADFTFAWPIAEIGVMGATQAVGILHRRELADAGDNQDALRQQLVDEYSENHLSPEVAAQDGLIDEVINPDDTRAHLAWGLGILAGQDPAPGHGNIPL